MSSERPGLALCCALAACEDCLPEQHEYRGLRVLGVEQSPLPARSGSPVRLRVVTLDAAARPVQVAWYACPSRPRSVSTETPLSPSALVSGSAEDCVTGGEIGRGDAIVVTPPGDRGVTLIDRGAPVGRWVTYAGVACAGALLPPAGNTPWPRCADGVIAPFVTHVRVLGTPDDPLTLPPLRIDAIELDRGGDRVHLAEVTVPPCAGPRASCAPVRVRVRRAPDGPVVDASTYTAATLDDLLRPRMSYLVSASAPTEGESACLSDDPRSAVEPDGSFGWVPPATPQDVTLAVTLRDVLGRFVWARATVRVR